MGLVRRRVVTQVENVVAAVVFRRLIVGVLDKGQKRELALRQVHPVQLVGHLALHRQNQGECAEISQPVQALSIVRRQPRGELEHGSR